MLGEAARLIGECWEETIGDKIEFEPDVARVVEKAIARTDAQRETLGLVKYDPRK